MRTRPVKSLLSPLRVTIPLESDGTVSWPPAVPGPLFTIGPLMFRFGASVSSLKSVALSLKSLFPTSIVPEKTLLLPPAALRVAPPPTMVMVLVIVEFTAAISAPPEIVTAPPKGRLEAFTARMPPLTRVTPPRGLVMLTGVAPPKVRAWVKGVFVVGLLSVAMALEPIV